MSSPWRYIATRLNGDGTETRLDVDLPLQKPELQLTLNGHGGLKATISPEVARLRSADAPIFVPWSTAIYAEADGVIRGGGILENLPEDGPALSIDCVGHSGYLSGTRYTGEKSTVRGDPIAMSWHMWQATQARKGFNIGMTRTGATKSREMFLGDDDVAASTTAQKVDPYVLAWWQTHDLAKEFEDMAGLAPFEWTVRHAWDGEQISHELVYGYPRLGRRRDDLRFVVGENVSTRPAVQRQGEDYASEVLVLGAGEGRAMMRAEDNSVARSRLGRDVVVMDKTITTPNGARTRAAAEAKARSGGPEISELTVLNHPHAALGTYSVGDDIYVETAPGWSGVLGMWLKILSITISPDSQESVLAVREAGKVGA